MNYVWETGKGRRIMHIQAHTRAGQPLWTALCGIRHRFNRSINAPWGLGRKVCQSCQNECQEDR